MMFGLKKTTIKAIQDVFKKHPEIEKAILYGSRAKGTHRPGSDIDLTLQGKQLNLTILQKIENELDDLLLPYKIDLSLLHHIQNPELLEHIKRVGVVFYQKEKDEGEFYRQNHLIPQPAGKGNASGLKGEWREYRFSEFVIINPLVKLKKDETYSYVEMKDLNDGTKFCFPTVERKFTGGAKFQEGDTLFARITPCLENGKICKVKGLKNGVGFGSTEFLVFRGRENVSDNDFVYYLARWDEVRGYAESHFEGTSGRQRVPKECFDNFYLDLPPLPEQKAIAEVLSSLDDKIDLLHRQNKTLEQLAETLFNEKLKVNSEKWEEKSLDEIAIFLNGLPCQKYPPKEGEIGLPVIKIKEMKNGITENTDRASSGIPEEYIVQDGDMLFSWSGSIEITLWFGGRGALNQHLFKVSSKDYPQWFYYFWTKQYLNEFRDIAEDKATTMGHIQRHHLKDAKVLIPTNSELNDLHNEIGPLFEKLKTNSLQIRTLTQLRDTLLPKLMNGEVRVNQNNN